LDWILRNLIVIGVFLQMCIDTRKT
jgi:hypothetical protein